VNPRLPVTIFPVAKRLRVESDSLLIPERVRRRIEQFRSLDLAATPLDELAQALVQLLEGYATTTVQLRAEKIFRARKRTGMAPFSHFRELWYVPPEKSHLVPMGRLNDSSEVVFYCTDSDDIALAELRPTVGDRVCMLECEMRADAWMQVLPLGLHRYLERYKPELASHQYEDKEHDEQYVRAENREALKLLQDFLVEELVRIVPDDAKHLYKTTVALAHLLLPAEIKKHGLAYPSIAVHLQGMNFMLSRAAADELLIPKRAWELHLFEETGPLTFNARRFRALKDIEPDGNLSWGNLPE
jgi:RES domain